MIIAAVIVYPKSNWLLTIIISLSVSVGKPAVGKDVKTLVYQNR